MKPPNLTKALCFMSVIIILPILYNTINIVVNPKIYEKGLNYFVDANSNSDDLLLKEVKAESKVNSEMKYILQWTNPNNVPFVYMGKGQQGFIDRKCEYTNCFVTADRNYFDDITKFDLIAFAGPEVGYFNDLPKNRSVYQKYVFASIESSDNYPVCSNRFDGYFNWTWTYALDSEVQWGYFIIRNKNGDVVGPRKEMDWMKLEDMEPVNQEFKDQLKSKTKAAAWFVSNCHTRGHREDFVKELKQELVKYNLVIDIYGGCGNLQCPRDDEEACFKLIKKNYYFYLSFENSFGEDYVTEKLLNALNNDAVPIVYGGANYTRFMPDGIYLNARELGVTSLAEKMDELIRNPEKYADLFRWKNHYSYHRQSENVKTDEYCKFCEILNDEEMVEKTSVYEEFRKWWDPPGRC